MEPQELIDAARARSLHLERTRVPLETALSALVTDCRTLFEKVPEPPLYRRPNDPTRTQATALLEDARELLARAMALEREDAGGEKVRPWRVALEAHVRGLFHTREAQLMDAEEAWLQATALERQATGRAQAFRRTGETGTPRVFDPDSQRSRYDPSPEPELSVKLLCPRKNCHRESVFQLSPRHATHRFTCLQCHGTFIGYFGEALSLDITPLTGQRRRYVFRLQELGGGATRVECEVVGSENLRVLSRDLLAFLYTEERDLRAVLNLSTSRWTWVARSAPCFLATAVFGEEAPELEAFRRFRDERLLPTWAGRVAVRGYYAVGPSLARGVARSSHVRGVLRRGLEVLHRRLER